MPEISPDMAIKLLHTQRGSVEEGDEPDSTVKEIMKLASQLEKEKKESYSRRNLLKNFGPLIDEISKRVKGSEGKGNNISSVLDKLDTVEYNRNNILDILDRLDAISKVMEDSKTNSVAEIANSPLGSAAEMANSTSNKNSSSFGGINISSIVESIGNLRNAQETNISSVMENQQSVASQTRAVVGEKVSSTVGIAKDWIVDKTTSAISTVKDSFIAAKDWIVDKTTSAISTVKDSFIAAKDWIVDKVANIVPPWVHKYIFGPIKFIVGTIMSIVMGVGKIILSLALSTVKIIFSIISFLVTGVLIPIISFLITGVLIPIFSFLGTTVVLPLMGIIGTVLSAVIGGVATILTAIMPILLPILAIAALIFLIVYLISSSFRGWVNEAIGKVWEWLTNFATYISEWWASLWHPHSGFWAWLGSNLWTWWTEASQAIGGLVVDGLLRLGEWAWAFIEYLADGAQRLWNYLKTVPYLGAALEWIADTFENAWKVFVEGFDWVKDNILSPLWNLVEPFVTWIKEKIGQLLEWVFGLIPEETRNAYNEATATGSGAVGAAWHAGMVTAGLRFSGSNYLRDTLGMSNAPDEMSIKKAATLTVAFQTLLRNFLNDPTRNINDLVQMATNTGNLINDYGKGDQAMPAADLERNMRLAAEHLLSNGLTEELYRTYVYPDWTGAPPGYTGYMKTPGNAFVTVFDSENEDQAIQDIVFGNFLAASKGRSLLEQAYGNFPYSLEQIRAIATDESVEIGKQMLDSYRKAADGMIVRVAEAGDDEAIIPLNERGIEFMRGTLQAALARVDLPPVDLSDTEHRNLDAKFDEIKEAIAGMGKGLAAGMGKMRASSGNGDADKTKMDEQLQVNKILARGKLSGNGGRI